MQSELETKIMLLCIHLFTFQHLKEGNKKEENDNN